MIVVIIIGPSVIPAIPASADRIEGSGSGFLNILHDVFRFSYIFQVLLRIPCVFAILVRFPWICLAFDQIFTHIYIVI